MSSTEKPKSKAFDLYWDGNYERAGEYFTSAAYESLSVSVIGENIRALAHGLNELLYATLSFRRARVYDRCSNRARQGILVAEDARDTCYEAADDRGVLTEFVGDLEVIGQVGSPEETYRLAAEYYYQSDMGYTTSRTSDPLDSTLWEFFHATVRDAEHEIPDWFEPRYAYVSRLMYKTSEFPAIIDTLEDQQ
jgi:hypothetical protein